LQKRADHSARPPLMMGVADYECRRLLSERYFPLGPVLPEPVPLDGVEKIPDLISYANQIDITAAADWLRNNF
jgi:hypothetical protein